MAVYIVTGLGFGDEGKGGTVDLLARQGGPTVVIRHNGGAQAGHNVVLPDGTHHEFSQFGSGTFAGAATFLSKHMLINPLNMMNEAAHLQTVGVTDPWGQTFIDENAKIITPSHIDVNRFNELRRGFNRHGSCGEGIEACVQQDLEHPELTVRVKDLFEFDLDERLKRLHQYAVQLGVRTVSYRDNKRSVRVFTPSDDAITIAAQNLATQYRNWVRSVKVVSGKAWLRSRAANGSNLIFEGAQGVLLDEWHGFHPYTTWSTTTHDNALSLLQEIGYTGPVERLGVTRAYMTRHGRGPFVTEDFCVQHDEPHNRYSPWQGAFRQGRLDLVMLKYAIACCGGVDGLVVTHLDRSKAWKVAHEYVIDGVVFDNLPPGPKQNLEHQNKLARLLMNVQQPIYTIKSTEILLSTLNDIAPVRIASYGPTYADKNRQEVYL